MQPNWVFVLTHQVYNPLTTLYVEKSLRLVYDSAVWPGSSNRDWAAITGNGIRQFKAIQERKRAHGKRFIIIMGDIAKQGRGIACQFVISLCFVIGGVSEEENISSGRTSSSERQEK